MKRNQYKIWLIERKAAIITRNVRIYEDKFPAREWAEDEDVLQVPVMEETPSTTRLPVPIVQVPSTQTSSDQPVLPVLDPINLSATLPDPLECRPRTGYVGVMTTDAVIIPTQPDEPDYSSGEDGEEEDQPEPEESNKSNEYESRRYPSRVSLEPDRLSPSSVQLALRF